MTVYRISRLTALDGAGASEHGGRWNPRGVPVVYFASTVSLAILEQLVHLKLDVFPIGYSLIRTSLDDRHIVSASECRERLSLPPETPSQELGAAWAIANLSLALKVPSAIHEWEFNIVVNPRFPGFPLELEELKVSPFVFERRLFQRLLENQDTIR